jgi:hypothetical protein
MPSVGFEPMISASERPQTYALDSAATGTGIKPKIVKVEAAFYMKKILFVRNLYFN